ncbi:hypothetical protein Sme01_16230 [Sphaerisporangium melleum]|uniref:Uncharacterized protein n=1 Tax=Sphaerisporangium melleum TaxID=321316 RepID=A0A917RMM2_9ACTN|nr:hypothetical protein [Sphaerisporangium melleum]GGL14920.1 hypothetical protein GCM10007964_66210 [Sphaerisporangium melleum]GII69147.1 hypothetical protein Sme01_16230 [Sphaerisporangium melleum]
MSYEGWEYGYVFGVAGATAYAVVNPARALLIAAAITSVASKPSSLAGAGEKWREIAGGIEQIAADLKKQVDGAPEEDWTAEDRTALDGASRTVLRNLNEGGAVHLDAAAIMENLGKLSYLGGVTSALAGTVLIGLAISATIAKGIPGANLAAQGVAEATATGTQMSIRAIVTKFGLAAGAATLAYTAVQGKQGELESQIAAMTGQGKAAEQVNLPLTNLHNSPASGLPATNDPTGTTGQNGTYGQTGTTGQSGTSGQIGTNGYPGTSGHPGATI